MPKCLIGIKNLCRPIWSVIILIINKSDSRCASHFPLTMQLVLIFLGSFQNLTVDRHYIYVSVCSIPTIYLKCFVVISLTWSRKVNNLRADFKCKICQVSFNKGHGEILRLCIGLFTTSIRNKNISQIVNKNTSPYFYSVFLVVCPLTVLKGTHFTELSITTHKRCPRVHSPFPDARSEKRKILAQNYWAAMNLT